MILATFFLVPIFVSAQTSIKTRRFTNLRRSFQELIHSPDMQHPSEIMVEGISIYGGSLKWGYP
jgi:hypothetical protein